MEKYTPSESILEKIREYEKFVNHWYKDGNGFWTLGYGHKKTLNDKYIFHQELHLNLINSEE